MGKEERGGCGAGGRIGGDGEPEVGTDEDRRERVKRKRSGLLSLLPERDRV